MIDKLPDLVNCNARLVHRGRFLNTAFLVEIGDAQHVIEIRAGRIAALSSGHLVMPRWTFGLRAPRDVWDRFWQPLPPPGFHDLFAMMKSGQMRIEGDLYPFMSNLLYFKDVMAAPRPREATL